ncbi:hypothetical protein HMPREF9123_2012 [Neisseria bacilliformis ATCC BAA-1200]|uniref:Uncharacterized protein n=1 Tax=Neisseria bacilliformis ATCC BAA-1200 TaxID=888742 RepID=F2BE56_9NEIS|nr:hypothetical protein HMPREF9123_2012 [Neisseria bacilliformis ATCC BAA-1200]
MFVRRAAMPRTGRLKKWPQLVGRLLGSWVCNPSYLIFQTA